MDAIVRFDTELFTLINRAWTSPFLDTLMPYVTEKFNFLGAIIVAALLIWVLGKRQDRIGLVLLVVLVLLSDLASGALKDVFTRVRPCHAVEGARLLVGCGGSFSLPSSHATNIFAAMVFLSLRYRKLSPAFLSMAILVSYSRVYVGVHYPADVAFGAALGTSCALIMASVEKGYLRRRLVTALEILRAKRGPC